MMPMALTPVFGNIYPQLDGQPEQLTVFWLMMLPVKVGTESMEQLQPYVLFCTTL